MPKYRVPVKKSMTATGTVEVTAKSAEEAQAKVQAQIDSGKLQTTAVEWGDPSYEEYSFEIDGDAEEA